MILFTSENRAYGLNFRLVNIHGKTAKIIQLKNIFNDTAQFF